MRTLLVLAALAIVVGPARAQFGGEQGPPPEDEEKKIERKDVAPPPEPLSADAEAARERAAERGVLRAESAAAGELYEIRVAGAKKVEPDAVLVHVQSRVGKRADLRVVQGDVRRIFGMGLFSDVIVEAREGPNDSVILVYRLVEKPAVDEVVVEGNKEVSKDDIDEVIDLKAYQVLDVPRVRANVEKIKKLYVDKGFFLVDVGYTIRPSAGRGDAEKKEGGLFDMFDDRLFPWDMSGDEDDEDAKGPDVQPEGEYVDVVFRVDEQAKVKVEHVRFTGNANVSDDELKSVMRTRENHPLGALTEWGTYKEEGAEIDLLAIEAVYQDKGYINVKVGQPIVKLSADRTRISMTIPIVEGDSYTLKSLDVGGDLILEDEAEYERRRDDEVVFLKSDLLGRTKIKPGDVFARSQVAQDVNAIADRYRDRGYAYANIVPDTDVDDKAKSIGLDLRIASGPRVTVERVEITGNSKTQDRVIRRELRVYEGEYYSASALRLSEQRVTALGFFEKVDVTTRQGSAPDRMVVVFDVKEKSTGQFQLGAGFSNAESFIFTGQIAYNNFLGLGQTVSGSWQWSAFRNIIDVRFVDPYAFYIGQEPITFAFSGYNTQRNFIDFLRNSTGTDVTLGYPVGRPFRDVTLGIMEDSPSWLRPYVPDLENFQAFLTGNLERVEIDDTQFNVLLAGLAVNVPRYTTSLKASLLFDQRNNRLFPSQGYFLQVHGELAHPYLGSALAPSAEAAAKDALQASGLRDFTLTRALRRNARANDFQRYGFTGRVYYNFDELLPLRGVVAKANLELGYIVADEQLVFENFFLGGFNTIRGYFPRSISPVVRVGGLDPTDRLVEFKIGGDKQLFGNVELEFPIFEQVGIRGVLFGDAGNAYAPNKNFFFLGDDPTFWPGEQCKDGDRFTEEQCLPLGLYYSVGAGVRWFSPIGPLRFEWGVPLTPRPAGTFGFAAGDQPFLFEFNIGNSF